jgi:tetratricopeptide (TPR) repeat protein
MPCPMAITSLRKRFWHQGLLCAGLILLLSSAQAAQTVQSPSYGTALFYYFQEDYFTALSELMAAQQLNELGAHQENAELLRGGMSLSYGMDRASRKIFETLLAAPDASIDRDQAWFYLAKLAWQRDDPDRSAAALAKMSASYDGPLAPEANYLRATIALRRGDEQGVAGYDSLIPRNVPWPYYLYYSLGATHAARADWDVAVEYFHRVDQSPIHTPEINTLRDKANTASGYALLAAGNYEQAAEDFTRVRLESPLVDRALLGYGWANSEMGDYQSALSPWLVLGERSVLSDSVRESLLAIPYAFEKLGRRHTALKKYRHASEVYATQLQALRAAIVALREGDLSRQSGPAGGYSQDWLSGQGVLPQGEHLPYIRHLITKRNFQVALRELHDLHSLAFSLSEARQRLRVLARVDEEQRESWATVIKKDHFTLLKDRQQQLLAQLEQLRRPPEVVAEAGDTSPLAGQLPELRALAQESLRRMSRVEDAIALRKQTDYVPRISALRERVLSQERRVQDALRNAREHISQLAIAELQQQAAKLDTALGQARLAVARLYDDAGSSQVQR